MRGLGDVTVESNRWVNPRSFRPPLGKKILDFNPRYIYSSPKPIPEDDELEIKSPIFENTPDKGIQQIQPKIKYEKVGVIT